MVTVIMAGGRGTRISSIASDIPKPMIKVDGKPILEHEIEGLCKQGFTDIIITVSYLGNIIMDYFKDGRDFGVNIKYYKEDKPLGNAGALFKIKESLSEDFLLLNADSLFDIDFNRFVDFHKKHNGLVSLFTHPNNHPYDSGLIITEKNDIVSNWLAKEDIRPQYYANRVNAGIHIINKSILDSIDGSHIGEIDEHGNIIKMDLDRDLLKPLAKSGKMYCYDSPEYVKDMGTPERLNQVENDILSGITKSRNLCNKQKAIFLDRDGTINKYVGFLRDINKFELLDGVSEAIRKINLSQYLCIVVTNQPIIARGELSVDGLTEIHNKMETLLGNDGAYIDKIYYCPHHPDKGYDGEISELKIECECRKPKPGLIVKASKEFNIDLEKSWMIGDSERDILAGKNAGCKTILIGNEEYGQDYTTNSLQQAIKFILGDE